MSEKPQDLKPRTKTFALRVIRMYSKLPKNDTVAQVLRKQVLRSGTKNLLAKHLRNRVVLRQFGIHTDDSKRKCLRSRFQILWLFTHIVLAFSLFCFSL